MIHSLEVKVESKQFVLHHNTVMRMNPFKSVATPVLVVLKQMVHETMRAFLKVCTVDRQ